jgi:hypothetical protein
MDVSRREFVVLGVGLLAAAGCANQANLVERPGPAWPGSRPRPDGSTEPGYTPPRQASYTPHPAAPISPPQLPAVADPQPSHDGALQAIPRSRWAKADPILKQISPMGGVDCITVHHEGWKRVYVTDMDSTAALIEHDRIAHLGMFHAGDIGYHYIIDRKGRLWEGRNVRYQGAHVRSHNEHNIGVMCLGNFDLQDPTDAQVNALTDTVAKLARIYKVSTVDKGRNSRIRSHQEINPTACPGRNLQPRFVYLRHSGGFA